MVERWTRSSFYSLTLCQSGGGHSQQRACDPSLIDVWSSLYLCTYVRFIPYVHLYGWERPRLKRCLEPLNERRWSIPVASTVLPKHHHPYIDNICLYAHVCISRREPRRNRGSASSNSIIPSSRSCLSSMLDEPLQSCSAVARGS